MYFLKLSPAEIDGYSDYEWALRVAQLNSALKEQIKINGLQTKQDA